MLGHPLPDGSWALLHRDRERTAAGLDAQHPGDGEAWLDAVRGVGRRGRAPHRRACSPRSRRCGTALGLLPRLRRVGGLRFVQTLLTPAADLGRSRFGGEHARLLLAGNAGHADIPLTAPGSGLLALVLVMLGQTVGFPVPQGGAGRLAGALRDRFASRGGEVRCEAEVTRVVVERGRATGVRLADGTSYDARRAVLADVAAPHLFGGLVDADDLPARVARGMRGFTMDPGTVKVDWALDRPVPWASPPEVAPGTVHVADSVDELAASLDQVSAGHGARARRSCSPGR